MPSRTPRADLTHNFEATSDPTSTDDLNAGFEAGSRWVNTSNAKHWVCVGSSVGAAVWKDTTAAGSGSHPVTVDTTDPDANDDANAGFDVGDHWINTATQQIFQAVDVANGAAVWERVDQPKFTVTTTDPTGADDSNDGYEIGSTWVNTTNGRAFTAIDVSVGAAVWRRNTNLKHTVTTTDPGAANDNTQDYEIGSTWVNTSAVPPRSWVAVGVGTSSAEWTRQTNLKSNTSASAPTAANDNTQGYEIGSVWTGTSAPRTIYVAVDVSTGAAVWARVSNVKINTAATDPTTADDNTQGYEISSVWINTASSPPRSWVALDVATGAAVWLRQTNLKGNATGSNPTTGDDTTQGYEIGSVWVNTSTEGSYVAVDVSTGAAVWVRTSNRKITVTTTDPTASNDSTQDYVAGSIWINTTAPTRSFECVSNGVGAAVWLRHANGPATGDLADSFPSPTVAQASKSFALSGVLSPASFSTTQNDYNPAGLATANTLRLTTTADSAITGIAGGSTGRLLTVYNVGSFKISFTTQSASSTAANRLAIDNDVLLLPDTAVLLQYDATSARWRVAGAGSAVPTLLPAPKYFEVEVDTTTSSSSFVTMFSGNFSLASSELNLIILLQGNVSVSSNNRRIWTRVLLNGVSIGGSSGNGDIADVPFHVGFLVQGTGVVGNNTVVVQWRRRGATAQCRPVTVPDEENASLAIWSSASP